MPGNREWVPAWHEARALCPAGQVQPPPPGALLCSCSGGAEMDVRLETHSFPLPRAVRAEAVCARLPVFLVNDESQLVVGPFYAKHDAVVGNQARSLPGCALPLCAESPPC